MIKKGQLIGQPFVYIFLLIVAAVVLFLGIKVLANVLQLGESVGYNEFVNDLKKAENEVYSDSFGSTLSLENINVPSFISEICFLDRYRTQSINLSLVRDLELRDFINVSYYSSQNENVFFASDDLKAIKLERVTPIDKVYSEPISENAFENPLCDDSRDGKINILFENQGDSILAQRI